jgi:threonine/homoserine/homoserine lactone efflux protein
MTGFELTVAVLVLLLTPGPTNSLMLLAGAERGLTGALRLIPAEVAGYLLTVLPLAHGPDAGRCGLGGGVGGEAVARAGRK